MILPKHDLITVYMSAINKIFFESENKTKASLNISDVIYAQQIHMNAMLRKHVNTSPGSRLEIQHLGVNNLSLSHFIMPIEIRNTMKEGS